MAMVFAVVYSAENGKYPETRVHIVPEHAGSESLKVGGYSIKNGLKKLGRAVSDLKDKKLRLYIEEHDTIPQEKRSFGKLSDVVHMEVRHYSYDSGRNGGRVILHEKHTSYPRPPR